MKSASESPPKTVDAAKSALKPTFCGKCGAPISKDAILCRACGAEVGKALVEVAKEEIKENIEEKVVEKVGEPLEDEKEPVKGRTETKTAAVEKEPATPSKASPSTPKTESQGKAAPKMKAKKQTLKKGRCPNCGRRVQRDWQFCPNCSQELPKTCPHCKEPVRPEWNFCPACTKELPKK